MLIPRSRILLSQEVLLMALRPPSAFHWPRELRLMLMMLGLSAFFLSREVLLMVCERRGG